MGPELPLLAQQKASPDMPVLPERLLQLRRAVQVRSSEEGTWCHEDGLGARRCRAGLMGPSVCVSLVPSSYQHIQDEPVLVGTRYGPVPTVPHSHWVSEPGSVPMAVARGWGRAQRSVARPAPSMMYTAFKFPSVEVEEEEKDENIPAPDNVPRGAMGGEFVTAQARGASGRCGAEDTGVVMVDHPVLVSALDPNHPPSSSGRAQVGLCKALLAAFLGWGP